MYTKYALLVIFIISGFVYTQSTNPEDYASNEEIICNPQPININAGDVISADVLNEVLTRINNLQTGGIDSEQDLVGTWSCTSTCRPGACDDGDTANGFTKNSLGLFTVSQKIEITSIKDGTQVRLSYPYNLGQSFVETGFQSCDAIVRNGKIFVSAADGVAENEFGWVCANTGNYPIEMVSNQYFRMSNINDSVANCRKDNIPPAAPLSLKVSLSGSTASLTWQKGDERQTGYDLKRKQTVDGDYQSIASISTDTFSDSTITAGNTYWYRVFATNEYGTGNGSNVVSVTYSE